MDKGTCSTPDCDDPVTCRGMCKKHYSQWWWAENPARKSPASPCSVDGCDSPVKALGLCNMHYRRQLKGKPIGNAAPLVLYGDPLIRFEQNIDRDNPDGHWIWTGAKNKGYGVFNVDGQMMGVHRWAYLHFVGPIPEDYVPDHLCRTPACANVLPEAGHIELVTQRENSARGFSPPAINARKTHCPQGHPYDEANTWYSKDGWRQCRTCWAIKDAKRGPRRKKSA